jgi:hypothetical protein
MAIYRLLQNAAFGREAVRLIISAYDEALCVLKVTDHGPHALVFPCRRHLHGWINSETKKRVEDLRPTHWREWQAS